MARALKVARPSLPFSHPIRCLLQRLKDSTLPYAYYRRIGGIVYSPLASGLLSGGMTCERIAAMPEDDWRKRSANFRKPGQSSASAEIQLNSIAWGGEDPSYDPDFH
jgi:aryl-alcohol dehydrogenase-like predicted oxidoreductase